MIHLIAQASNETKPETVSIADRFFPTPFDMHPLLFVLLLLIIGSAVIAGIITYRVRRRRSGRA